MTGRKDEMAKKLKASGLLTARRAISCLGFLAFLSSAIPPSAQPRAGGHEGAAISAPPKPVTAKAPAFAPFPAVVVPAVPKPALTAADFQPKVGLAVDHWLRPGEYAWDDEGVPAGPMRIVVDLEARQLHAYRGGVEIGRASIMYGDDEKPTPTGIFPILEKDRNHVSNLYDAPMPYMLRLTWDGISIHASDVRNEYATHGCVGIPDEFAALLFASAKPGDPVLITNKWIRYQAETADISA